MKKLWLKKVRKHLNKGLEKMGTFLKVLWRDKVYLVVKISFLLFFAATVKASADPSLNTQMADMCVGVAGLLCIVPVDRILPEEEKPRRKRREREEDDDVQL